MFWTGFLLILEGFFDFFFDLTATPAASLQPSLDLWIFGILNWFSWWNHSTIPGRDSFFFFFFFWQIIRNGILFDLGADRRFDWTEAATHRENNTNFLIQYSNRNWNLAAKSIWIDQRWILWLSYKEINRWRTKLIEFFINVRSKSSNWKMGKGFTRFKKLLSFANCVRLFEILKDSLRCLIDFFLLGSLGIWTEACGLVNSELWWWACTYDLDEFGHQDAILQVFRHVFDEVESRPLPQLTVHPRRVGLISISNHIIYWSIQSKYCRFGWTDQFSVALGCWRLVKMSRFWRILSDFQRCL